MATLPLYPYSGKADVAKEVAYRKDILNLENYVLSGFGVTSGTSTTFAMAAGIAAIVGLKVGDGVVIPNTLDVSGNGTKKIYMARNGIPEVLTDPTVPSRPYVLLYTISVSGGVVTIVTDHRGLISGVGRPALAGGLIVRGNLRVDAGIDAQSQRVQAVGVPQVASDAARLDTVTSAAAAVPSRRSVLDKDLSTPPGSPADGDRYIVGASPTGAWATHAGKIAEWSASGAAWSFETPAEGWTVEVRDEDEVYLYLTSWVRFLDQRGFLKPVASKSVSAPPGSPAAGDRYIVGPSPTGAWTGHANEVAEYTSAGAWQFYLPVAGQTVFVTDKKNLFTYRDATNGWRIASGGGDSASGLLLMGG